MASPIFPKPNKLFEGAPGPSPWYLRWYPPRIAGYEWRDLGQSGDTVLHGPSGPVLIVGYYQGDGHGKGRRRLAQRLGITYSSLKTRAHRIRNALEGCLHECLEASRLGDQ